MDFFSAFSVVFFGTNFVSFLRHFLTILSSDLIGVAYLFTYTNRKYWCGKCRTMSSSMVYHIHFAFLFLLKCTLNYQGCRCTIKCHPPIYLSIYLSIYIQIALQDSTLQSLTLYNTIPFFNSSPKRILDQPKFKAFADDKIQYK